MKRALLLVAGLAIAGPTLPSAAQTTSSGAGFQNQFPDPLTYQPPRPDPPELQFESVTDIGIVGPLVSGPRDLDGAVYVGTAAGPVRVNWAGPTPTAERVAFLATEPSADWGLSPDRSHRAKPVDGRLVVQKACKGCGSGWRRRWRLRVPGLAPVPPVMTAKRVYFGSSDNRIYGVRRKNGHRLWATALEGRVLRELALWVATGTERAPQVAAILAVPEPGAELVVLDVYSGSVVLRYRLAEEGDVIVGSPVATPDGYVILARQGYTEQDASVIILKLVHMEPELPPAEETAPTSYNPETSDEVAPGAPVADPRADPPALGSPKMP
ncbi:MAG: PQQ-binding-like beta-propeller repeat protein [Acidobacteria bacterium]|nr:PQQ-binding-like beta-propeller repeat protein [Acidobacteriota bacterium]NIM62127.1 PQQ-binding-like beta-propeller repeat protein [Acidobacteriota bacterium]NIO59781.1 PQQ-binding-like beta-propeller repeat protein [Acidobacteriota bacterium]NIQ30864.1 PQQ-binding-like beta-propeller repeat protein [Acidobacteriota bacterium]NIQ85937.1 PQQ-binding-like beta-propeller repeat protein [Acidobacteriota bacterium]